MWASSCVSPCIMSFRSMISYLNNVRSCGWMFFPSLNLCDGAQFHAITLFQKGLCSFYGLFIHPEQPFSVHSLAYSPALACGLPLPFLAGPAPTAFSPMPPWSEIDHCQHRVCSKSGHPPDTVRLFLGILQNIYVNLLTNLTPYFSAPIKKDPTISTASCTFAARRIFWIHSLWNAFENPTGS